MVTIHTITIPKILKKYKEITSYIIYEIKKLFPEQYVYRAFNEEQLNRVINTGTDRDKNLKMNIGYWDITQKQDQNWLKMNYGLEIDEWFYATTEIDIPVKYATENFLLEALEIEEQTKKRAIAVYSIEGLRCIKNELGKKGISKPIYEFKNKNNKKEILLGIFLIKKEK